MEGDTAVDSIKIKTMSIKIKAQSYKKREFPQNVQI